MVSPRTSHDSYCTSAVVMEEPQTKAAGYGGLSKVSDKASPDSRVDKT